jgi:hypothetical protein
MSTPTLVLLRHDLPDGSFHHDLMVQLNGPRQRGGLHTWRVAERLHELKITEPAGFWAEPLGEHREAYLTFEGDIGGGRGTVSRVAEGLVHVPHPDMIVTTDQVVFDATWWTKPLMNRRVRFAGARGDDGGGGGRWWFTMSAV